MKATELVGKDAIRTAPAQYPNGNSDCSYMSEPIHIAKATDAHIVFFIPLIALAQKYSATTSRTFLTPVGVTIIGRTMKNS